MKHSIEHDLDPKLAKLAAEKAVVAYGERFADYDFAAKWVNDKRVELGFTVAGKRLEGSMDVESKALALELDVPFVFRVFSGKAIQIIEKEAKVWIDKARKGELGEG